jgi:eukaryotic-like serine/threonine-protein kinase
MKIKELFRSRTFWLNLSLMVAGTVLLFWMGLKMLDIYTRHGSGYVVPDFSGMTPEEILTMPGNEPFRIVISDSVYDNSRQGGIVLEQEPLPGSEVKRNRTIHLTIVSKQQEMVPLPDLGNTVRSARSQLEAFGLRIGKVTEVQGEFVGLLQRVSYMGREIYPGERIPRGATIDIEVSMGKDFFDPSETPEEDEAMWHGNNNME